MAWQRKMGGSPSPSSSFPAAMASISGEKSTPIISYPRWARRKDMVPVPQARSSTVFTGRFSREKSFSKKSAQAG